ncbi:hypothetical protein QQF64_034372 [Cirrhinus molitorella]|uniref:Uncharacterized protein n=1 Tax=Cirrhinus molitorella TaxID=172907 RepID=A0ABR3L1M0_9TELE
MKTTIKDMEGNMSVWTDEVNELQAVVSTLKTELKELRDKSGGHGGEDATVQYSNRGGRGRTKISFHGGGL